MGEWRKVETATPEGATADHTAYDWQFGAEIDGVFVPAVTKAGGYVDSLIASGKQAQQASGDQQQPTATTQTGQPNEGFGNTPAGSTGEQTGGSTGEGGAA